MPIYPTSEILLKVDDTCCYILEYYFYPSSDISNFKCKKYVFNWAFRCVKGMYWMYSTNKLYLITLVRSFFV